MIAITKLSKTKDRLSGGILIRKSDKIKFLQNQFGSKLERNRKRYSQKRSGLVKLVAKYPEESIATIRQWMFEID